MSGMGRRSKFEPDPGPANQNEKQCRTVIKLSTDCNLLQTEIYYFDRQTVGKYPDRKQVKNQAELDTPSSGHGLSSPSVAPHQFHRCFLVCGRGTFWCHKFVLSARSVGFALMFSHVDTTWGKTNKVETTDGEKDTLE